MLNIFILFVLLMLAASTIANPRTDIPARVETPRYENDHIQATVEQNVIMVEVNNMDKTQGDKEIVDWRGHIFNLNDPLELDKLDIDAGEAFKCCKLGTIAGIRGYHCRADLYTGNIMKRNENRPHNKRIYFRGKHHRGMYGVNLMSQFGKCSQEMSEQFDSCCRVASRIEMKIRDNSVHLSR